jgi:transposase InsO family protein
VQAALGVSERRACRALSQSRSTQRRTRPVRSAEAALAETIVALAAEYGRYGYRRITAMLHADGWRVNAKRVQQSEAMPRAAVRGAEGAAAATEARPPVAERRLLQPAGAVLARHVWAYDFVQDRTHDGRLFRMLTVIGEFTRECLPSPSPATSPRMTCSRC